MAAPQLKQIAYDETIDDETTVIGWVELLAGATVGSVYLIDPAAPEVEITIAAATPADDAPSYKLDSFHRLIRFTDLEASDKVFGRVGRRNADVLVLGDVSVEIE